MIHFNLIADIILDNIDVNYCFCSAQVLAAEIDTLKAQYTAWAIARCSLLL